MDVPEINLAEYHLKVAEAVVAQLGASIQGAFAYKTFKDAIPQSVSIELDGILPGDPADTGTEQFHAELRFSAYVVVPFLQETNVEPKLLVRQLATRLIPVIRGSRFGCPGAGVAQIVAANPDEFSLPGKTGRAGSTEEYEVWRIEWTFEAYVGDSVWTDDGTVPVPVEVWSETSGEETRIA